MIRLTALLAAASIALTTCDAPTSQTFVQPNPKGATSQSSQMNAGFSVAPANAPSGPLVDNFARNFLNTLQVRSIAERREHCGYFFIGSDGRLQASTPRGGTFASCDMPAPLAGQGIVASYHTHGAYGRRYDNEVPSVIDLTSDFDFGIDGYVSPPRWARMAGGFPDPNDPAIVRPALRHVRPGISPTGRGQNPTVLFGADASAPLL
ncbi:DUF4329 domain-containing protein [Octadecabacter arcticus]|uniref:DUF4329 domain-containing protein n=1 Tax=Octadecabacter arcticus TaxID=53946 RepID=UPI0002E041CF|nr:DUF4329 domain-containing protein [Octadecabacter arcticus]